MASPPARVEVMGDGQLQPHWGSQLKRKAGHMDDPTLDRYDATDFGDCYLSPVPTTACTVSR